MSGPEHGPADDQEPDATRDRLTRRHFVTTGAVLGAAVVWGAPFPFVDKQIGAAIASADGGPTGPTGPTGPASPSGGTATQTPVVEQTPAGTGTTGTVEPAKPTYQPDRVVIDGLRDIRAIKVTKKDIHFGQRFVEPGAASWIVDLSWTDKPATDKHKSKPKVHRRQLAAGRHAIDGAGRADIVLKLTKAGRDLLAHHPDGRLVLRTTFTDGRGRKLPSNRVLRQRP